MKLHFPLFNPDPGAAGGGGAPAAAWHESIISKGADGNEALADPATWLDKAPAPLAGFIRNNMTAARAKTEGMVRVPGADAKPEDVQAFYKALGVPDTPEGYDFKAPEKLPDGVVWDDGFGKAFTVKARELGLTKAQAEGLKAFQIETVGGNVQQMREKAQQALDAEKADLSRRFGDTLDTAVSQAKSLATARGVPESLKKAAESGAFDPTHENFWGVDALEFAVWAAKASGEDKGGGGAGVNQGAASLAAAKDIMNNKSNPEHAKYWAGDKAVVAKVQAAYQAAG